MHLVVLGVAWLLPRFVNSFAAWNGAMGQGGMQQNPMWGDTNMFGMPYGPHDMMGVTMPPLATTKAPSRREYLLKVAPKRKSDGLRFNKAKYDRIQAEKTGTLQNKDELDLFVDSVKKMATGFKRLEYRLTKAVRMIDKFVI